MLVVAYVNRTAQLKRRYYHEPGYGPCLTTPHRHNESDAELYGFFVILHPPDGYMFTM
jgi:hypothetical protein